MFKKLAMNLGLKWLGAQAREIAEGKKGPEAQSFYLSLVGKKRAIGIILALTTAALLGAHQTGAAEFVTGPLALLALSLGFADANWRALPDLDSAWLRIARAHAFDVAAVMGLVSAALTQCNATLVYYLSRVHLDCHSATLIVAGLSAVLAQLGINAEAQAARPPAVITVVPAST